MIVEITKTNSHAQCVDVINLLLCAPVKDASPRLAPADGKWLASRESFYPRIKYYRCTLCPLALLDFYLSSNLNTRLLEPISPSINYGTKNRI